MIHGNILIKMADFAFLKLREKQKIILFLFFQKKMALENFLWEFGCKDEEWLKPKKNNHEPCDGVVQQEDVDMLRNVQVSKNHF